MYQEVLNMTLIQHQQLEDGGGDGLRSIILLEDDALLLDPIGFLSELYVAMQLKLDYYSFFQTAQSSSIPSCLYEWGTQSQLISTKLIKQFLDTTTNRFCRLPVDMWIAQTGPYYSTRRRLVQHVGKRLHAYSKKETR
jgi:hypothetical protein